MIDDEIFDGIKRIEAKLDRVINGPESPTVCVPEAMHLAGVKSRSALYRRMKELGIKPYSHGKYYRESFLAAISSAKIKNALNQ